MSLFPKIIISIIAGMSLTFLLLSGRAQNYGAAIFLIVFPIFFARPYYYFLFFIIIRPIIDLSIRGGLPGGKLSSLVVIPLIFLCLKDVLMDKDKINLIRTNPCLKIINLIFLLIFAGASIAFINTDDVMVSLQDMVRLFSVFISVNYAVVYFSSSDEKKKGLIKLILFSAVVPFLFGFKQLVTHTGIQETGYNRIFGTFAHCNVFAQYLLMNLFLSFYLYTHSAKKTWTRRLAGLFMAVAFTSFYFTYTRTLWIAFGMAVLVYIFLKPGLSKKLIYLGVILLIAGALSPLIKSRFSDDADKQSGRRSSWEWRLEVWGDAIKDLEKHPFMGNGLGMFEKEVGVMAHNDFIRIAYESGIPTAGVFFIFFCFLFFGAVMGSKKAPEDEKDYFIIAACLTTGLFISSLAVNTLRSTVIMFYYLCVIAVFIQPIKRELPNENPPSQ